MFTKYQVERFIYVFFNLQEKAYCEDGEPSEDLFNGAKYFIDLELGITTAEKAEQYFRAMRGNYLASLLRDEINYEYYTEPDYKELNDKHEERVFLLKKVLQDDEFWDEIVKTLVLYALTDEYLLAVSEWRKKEKGLKHQRWSSGWKPEE